MSSVHSRPISRRGNGVQGRNSSPSNRAPGIPHPVSFPNQPSRPKSHDMRVLSGIKPTGTIHWGNYFGAIRQYIDLQDNEQAFYFIANLHALNQIRDAAKLRQYTFDIALDLLALGLDPNRATLFVQSDVPEVSELCWLLMTGAPMGLLERCHAYKDRKAKGLTSDAGVFA